MNILKTLVSLETVHTLLLLNLDTALKCMTPLLMHINIQVELNGKRDYIRARAKAKMKPSSINSVESLKRLSI